MFDAVKVAPETFRSPLMYTGSRPKRQFVDGQNIPDDQKPQAMTADGLPKWTVTVSAEHWRPNRDAEQLAVTVALADDPATKFQRGQMVEFVGLTFGVNHIRKTGGYSLWFSAEGIASVGGKS